VERIQKDLRPAAALEIHLRPDVCKVMFGCAQRAKKAMDVIMSGEVGEGEETTMMSTGKMQANKMAEEVAFVLRGYERAESARRPVATSGK
jgi:hypothetical protein